MNRIVLKMMKLVLSSVIKVKQNIRHKEKNAIRLCNVRLEVVVKIRIMKMIRINVLNLRKMMNHVDSIMNVRISTVESNRLNAMVKLLLFNLLLIRHVNLLVI